VNEGLYSISTIWIALALFLAMILMVEIGHYIGRAARKRTQLPPKDHVTGVQAALLGILALLLGFTLSLSLQRFDVRSAAVVDEANAIGTAYLRTQFLPESVRGEMRRLLRTYTDLRIQAGTESTVDKGHRNSVLRQANDTIDELWTLARKAVEQDANPVRTGLFVQALNDAIDSFRKSEAALDRHLPDLVLLLLFVTFLMVGLVVGYATGIDGYRAFFATYIMMALIVVLVFVIIDLDRPRRGLVQVSLESMTALRDSMTPPGPKN
jgi:ribose/xylose/arabinose/galactoside ABC-type transport system permease subunit